MDPVKELVSHFASDRFYFVVQNESRVKMPIRISCCVHFNNLSWIENRNWSMITIWPRNRSNASCAPCVLHQFCRATKTIKCTIRHAKLSQKIWGQPTTNGSHNNINPIRRRWCTMHIEFLASHPRRKKLWKAFSLLDRYRLNDNNP